jgi:hypothetical protein
LFDDWEKTLTSLALKGMAEQLARNAVVSSWSGQRLELIVDPSCASLLGSVAENKLAVALSEFAGVKMSLVLTLGSPPVETPAQRESRAAAAKQAETEADMQQDPFVLAAKEAFDAEIVPDSVRRLD